MPPDSLPGRPSPTPADPRETAAEQMRNKIHAQLAELRASIDAGPITRDAPQWKTFVDNLRTMRDVHGATNTYRAFETALLRSFNISGTVPGGAPFDIVSAVNTEGFDRAQKSLAALANEITPGRAPDMLTPEQRLNMQMNQIDGRITDMVGRLPPNIQAFLGGPEGAARTVRNLFSTLALNFSGNALTRAFAPQINKLGAEMALKNQIEAINPPPTLAQIAIWRGLLEAATKAKRANPARITELPMPNMQEIIANPSYPKLFQEELNKMLATPPAAPTVAPNTAVNVGGVDFPAGTTELPVTADRTINNVRGQNYVLKPDGQISIAGSTNMFRIRIGTTDLAAGSIKLLPPTAGTNAEDMRVQITQGATVRNVRLTNITNTLVSRAAGSTQNILQLNADNTDATLAS
jgi:hypothetical protein